MYKLNIHLKTALDLSNGPSTENLFFNSNKEIQQLFKHFPAVVVKENKVYKQLEEGQLLPIGDIKIEE